MRYITPPRKAIVNSENKVINIIVADDSYKLDTKVYPDCTLFDCGDLPIKIGDEIVNGKWDYSDEKGQDRELNLKFSDNEDRTPEQIQEMIDKRAAQGFVNSPDIVNE